LAYREGVHEAGMARLRRGTGHGGVIEQGVEEGGFPDIRAAQECDLGVASASIIRLQVASIEGWPHTSGTFP